MLGDDSNGIREFILDRLDQIHEENVLNDLEYQKLGAKPKAAMDQLWKSLDPDNRKLLDEFDCGRMAQMCRQDELIYSRGLMDGIRLADWLERIKRGEELVIP
jgi:hypothetical protein